MILMMRPDPDDSKRHQLSINDSDPINLKTSMRRSREETQQQLQQQLNALQNPGVVDNSGVSVSMAAGLPDPRARKRPKIDGGGNALGETSHQQLLDANTTLNAQDASSLLYPQLEAAQLRSLQQSAVPAVAGTITQGMGMGKASTMHARNFNVGDVATAAALRNERASTLQPNLAALQAAFAGRAALSPAMTLQHTLNQSAASLFHTGAASSPAGGLSQDQGGLLSQDALPSIVTSSLPAGTQATNNALGLASLLPEAQITNSLLGGAARGLQSSILNDNIGIGTGAPSSLALLGADARLAALGNAGGIAGLSVDGSLASQLLRPQQRLLALSGLGGTGGDAYADLLALRRLQQAENSALGLAAAAPGAANSLLGAASNPALTAADIFNPASRLSSSLTRPASRSQALAVAAPAPVPPPRPRPLVPPCEDGPIRHHSHRLIMPLATDEDENWLSEFSSFVRSDLVEVFRASNDDVTSRINSKKVAYGQVGIRCRHCAHLPHNQRSSRSACFPSSLSRIYQSLTMMIRDHFVRCTGMPDNVKERFLSLKQRATQGATDSKRYWVESAKKLGMVDTEEHGIKISEEKLKEAEEAAARGKPGMDGGSGEQANQQEAASAASVAPNPGSVDSELVSNRLVFPEDRHLASEYLYTLMTQVERVYLTESERVGNRKSMVVGLPGFGCKHCRPTNRKGLCRFFPARRRTLPAKIKDLHDHLRRCSLCPPAIKQQLAVLEQEDYSLKEEAASSNIMVQMGVENRKAFFDRIWNRLHNES